MLEQLRGPLLVATAAVLWGTDALFRFPASASLDPTFIVFCEHLVGVLILTPWILGKHRSELFKLNWKGWFAAIFVGAMGSAIATVLFTASFKYQNPSVTILLQKLQPIFVVLLAFAFLGERPAPKFYFWGLIAIGAGFVLSFPNLDVSFLKDLDSFHTRGFLYALGSSLIWAATTVAGRALLSQANASVGTFWRYIFGLLTLSILLSIAHVPSDWSSMATTSAIGTLLYLGIVSGVVPMWIYYGGLARTPANVTTFVELLYPVSAVILNTLFLNTPLNAIEIAAGSLLLFAVTMISI